MDVQGLGMSDSAADRGPQGAALHGPFLVDAHVHFYGCYDSAAFFDSGLANFRATANALGVAPSLAGCMLFTESTGHHFFRLLRDDAESGNRAPWSFHRTHESCSLIAARDGGEEILLVGGRQIATAERLEILALGCDRDFADGLALRPTLEAVLESGALAVLPWGFGKWWFRRGALMAELVESVDPAQVFLGDNSGRPRFLPSPQLFRLARARNVKILPGTDPLPFASEVTKVGSYGFVVEGEIDRWWPAEGLKRLALQQTGQPAIYGQLEDLGRFCRNQVMMQVRNRI